MSGEEFPDQIQWLRRSAAPLMEVSGEERVALAPDRTGLRFVWRGLLPNAQ